MKGPTLLAVLALAVAAGGLRAQQRAGPLERADSLANAGQADSARAALDVWWKSAWSRAPRRNRERALWLRGRLTADPAQAELDFERLVIEYPGGAFTDRALFRLAQEAFVAGDSAEASRRIADLQRDYPGSRTGREAKAWLQKVGHPLPPAAPEPEKAKAATHSRKRAERSTTRETRRGAASNSRAAAHRGVYAVQLGAFGSLSRARVQADRARKAGLEVRIVRLPGSRLVRVRTGSFDSAGSAHTLLRRVERLGFRAAVVGDVHEEERVRR